MMKKGKAADPTGIESEMFIADEDCSVEWLKSLCNLIVAQGRILDDWKSSILLRVFKGKGDPMECESYRAIKLLEHAMKVIERVFERRIREKVKIDAVQFGFMPGKGTTDAIFTVRQMQEKYGSKGKKLCFSFCRFGNAFDRIPREVTRWALRKAGVDECLVKAVMAMHEGAQTVVITTEGDSKAFNVKVGLHQGSDLSPLLFVIVMEMISRELQAGLPLELLYVGDLILMPESEESLGDKIVKWKSGLEAKGLKMNTGKTKVMFSCSMKDKVEEKGKWPCGVRKKGVSNNSMTLSDLLTQISRS